MFSQAINCDINRKFLEWTTRFFFQKGWVVYVKFCRDNKMLIKGDRRAYQHDAFSRGCKPRMESYLLVRRIKSVTLDYQLPKCIMGIFEGHKAPGPFALTRSLLFPLG